MKEKTLLRIWSKTQRWILLQPVFVREVVLRFQEKHLQLLHPINLRATEQVTTESLQKYFKNFMKCSNERPQILWQMRKQSDHAEQAHSNIDTHLSGTELLTANKPKLLYYLLGWGGSAWRRKLSKDTLLWLVDCKKY